MTSITNDLAEIFVTEQNRLMRLVRRIVGNPATAEDVVQDTFLNLLRKPPCGHVENSRAYLTRSAANLAIDHLRREQTRERHVSDGVRLEGEPCPQPLPDAVLQSRQELAILYLAVNELPTKCRAVFLLHRQHGLTMREIAAQVGISEKTVEKHLMRAMVHCRSRLRLAGRPV
jgi:RNA polymerase sigma-70 factor (ECF subfamily)